VDDLNLFRLLFQAVTPCVQVFCPSLVRYARRRWSTAGSCRKIVSNAIPFLDGGDPILDKLWQLRTTRVDHTANARRCRGDDGHPSFAFMATAVHVNIGAISLRGHDFTIDKTFISKLGGTKPAN